MEGPKVVGDEVIGNAVGWKEMVVNKVKAGMKRLTNTYYHLPCWKAHQMETLREME